MKHNKCLTCKYYDDGLLYPICRRYPPTFPMVGKGGWCGEYKKSIINKNKRE